MSPKTDRIEIEIDSPTNRGLFFAPLQRRLRGKLDFSRDSEPEAARAVRNWPQGIPGLILGINPASGQAWLREPLHQHAEVATRLARRHLQLDAEHQSQGQVDVPTWLYWMRRAVDASQARLIQGNLPSLDAHQQQAVKDFQTRPQSRADQRLERLIAALEAAFPKP